MVDDEAIKADEESTTLAPAKVHIRGVDTLHTDDIKAYVKAHYGLVDKVEWIDDASANLVFSSDAAARDAMVALSAIDIADPTALGIGEFLTAKSVQARPEIILQVRFALLSDRKQAGAALRSRYYLLHPEHDPEERRRRQQDNRSRYRERDGDYRRGGGGGGRDRRRDSDEAEPFDASMYDDAPAPARRRRLSDPEDHPKSYSRGNRGKELFAGRASGRDRSASPLRDADGDEVIGDDRLASSSRNRTSARSLKDRMSTSNKSKELFPSKASVGKGGRLDELEAAIGSARLKEEDRPKVVAVPDAPAGSAFNIRGLARQRGGTEGGFAIKGTATAKELFPTKLGGGSGNVGKELFDGSRSKPRQRAEDLFS